MVPRPRSPTALLWAFELRRQYERLLERVKTIEGNSEKVAEAVTGLERKEDELRRLTTEDRSGLDSQHQHLTSRLAHMEESAKCTSAEVGRMRSILETACRTELEHVHLLTKRLETVEDGLKRVGMAEADKVNARLRQLEDAAAQPPSQPVAFVRKDDQDHIRVLSRRLDAVELQRVAEAARVAALVARVERLESAECSRYQDRKEDLGRLRRLEGYVAKSGQNRADRLQHGAASGTHDTKKPVQNGRHALGSRMQVPNHRSWSEMTTEDEENAAVAVAEGDGDQSSPLVHVPASPAERYAMTAPTRMHSTLQTSTSNSTLVGRESGYLTLSPRASTQHGLKPARSPANSTQKRKPLPEESSARRQTRSTTRATTVGIGNTSRNTNGTSSINSLSIDLSLSQPSVYTRQTENGMRSMGSTQNTVHQRSMKRKRQITQTSELPRYVFNDSRA